MQDLPDLVLYVSAFVLALAPVALLRGRSTLARLFASSMVLLSIVTLAYHYELTAPDVLTRTRWLQVRQCATPFVPAVWLGIVLVYGRAEPRWRWLMALAMVVPVLNLPFTATMTWHEWVRYDCRLVPNAHFSVLACRWGFWSVVTVVVSYLVSLISLVLLARAWWRARARRRGLALVFWAYALPLGGELLSHAEWSLPGVNLSMVALAGTSALLYWALFRHGVFDLVPVARSLLFEHAPSLLFVVTPERTLADVNGLAAERLGVVPEAVLGRPVDAALPAPWAERVLQDAAEGGAPDARIELGGARFERRSRKLTGPLGDDLGVLLSYLDVTEQIRSETERRFLQQQTILLRDLHDGIGGIAVNIGMVAALGLQAPKVEDKDATLRNVAGLAHEASSEIRSLMNTLESRDLTWSELVVELRRHGASVLEEHDLSFALETEGTPSGDGPGLLAGMSLFRLFREALTNVLRHARARGVCVTLRFLADRVILQLTDDGVGLPAQPKPGRGLRNMRERTAELGGRFTVESAPGAGTTLRFEFSLPLRPLDLQPPAE